MHMAGVGKGVTYGQTGVDVGIEALAARILYQAAKKTWANREGKVGAIQVPYDDFAALRYAELNTVPPGTVISEGSDGIATKAEIAEKAGTYNTLAYDLMAMVCDDAVIRGGEPVLVTSVLDVNTLGRDKIRLAYIEQLAEGYIGAAKEAGVAVINGEIAQLNDRMGGLDGFRVNWSANVTWFAHKSRLITGKDVKAGDAIVGLREEGLRCNGISLIRKILAQDNGMHWDRKLGTASIVDMALYPSRIYAGAVVEMFGGYDLKQKPKASIHGAAHISGGGIPEKLGRALRPSGLGAVINNPFEPSELMLYCQEVGKVTDLEAYGTWNMGQGMAIITPEPEDVIKVAKDHGIQAKVIGEIVKEPGISIASKGFYRTPLKL